MQAPPTLLLGPEGHIRQVRNAGRLAVFTEAVDLLKLARSVAEKLALHSPTRTTHAGEVGATLAARGIQMGAWAGSLFRSPQWAHTGSYVKSPRPESRGRVVAVWKLL